MLKGLVFKGWWPVIVILALISGLIWFGIDYANTKQEVKDLEVKLEAKQKIADSLGLALVKCGKEVAEAKKATKADSVMMKGQIEDLQKLTVEIRADRDYWKDFAEKLETGEFCIERKGLRRKKVLVPCKK